MYFQYALYQLTPLLLIDNGPILFWAEVRKNLSGTKVLLHLNTIMCPKLSNGFLRELGLNTSSGEARARSSGWGKKRKVPPNRRDQRHADRAAKRSRQRGVFQPQHNVGTRTTSIEKKPQNYLNRNRFNQIVRQRTESNLQPQAKSKHSNSLPCSDDSSIHVLDSDSDLKLNTKKVKSSKKQPSPTVLNGLPWSDDDSIHTSDFDSEPKQMPKQSKVQKKHPERNYKVPKIVQERLDQDDREIARLEKKLGIKKDRKSLPQSFKDDGLTDLLGDSENEADEKDMKTIGAEDKEWLRQKRQKIRGTIQPEDSEDDKDENENSPSSWDENSQAGNESFIMDHDDVIDSEEIVGYNEGSDSDNFELGDEISQELRRPKMRENPYLPPIEGRIATNNDTATLKYIPPHLRQLENEETVRLRKQIKSLVNKVTQATIIPCLNDIDKLYRSNARQVVTEIAVDQILTATAEKAQLVDAFTVDAAGFAAAIFKIAGTDFVAHLVARSHEMFREYFNKVFEENPTMVEGEEAVKNKETNNIISLISALYSLEVIGPKLIYDYIRLLLDPNTFNERNTDLLMRIIQVCGPKLRKDDPFSLKGVAGMAKPAVAKIGTANLSFRTKFMIDNINDLVSNKPRAVKRYAISSERIVSMKKTLGSIKMAGTKSTEPLNLGFDDLKTAGTKGMWWRVGARWDGNKKHQQNNSSENIYSDRDDNDSISVSSISSEVEPDLETAAQSQGMNTEVRRAIFAAIMTGIDVDDGFRRLNTLRLNAKKQKEIPHVLVQCVGSEKDYNMYYALLARRFCAGHQMKYAFQASLWQTLRRLGEGLFDDISDQNIDEEEESDEYSGSGSGRQKWDETRIANVARFFGVLVAEGALSLRALRAVNILKAGNKGKEFLTLLVASTLIPLPEMSDRLYRKLKKGPKTGDGKVVEKIYTQAPDDGPVIAAGLLELLRRARKFKGLPKKEQEVLKWGVGVASECLLRRDQE